MPVPFSECFNVEESIWTSKGTIYPEEITGGVFSIDDADSNSGVDNNNSNSSAQ